MFLTPYSPGVASALVTLDGMTTTFTSKECGANICYNVLLFDIKVDPDATHSINVTNATYGLLFDYMILDATGMPPTMPQMFMYVFLLAMT
jgi:hypothetical protein